MAVSFPQVSYSKNLTPYFVRHISYMVDDVINPTATVGLPLDDCFGSGGTCPDARIGNGDFSSGLQSYLAVNYAVDYSSETPAGIPHWFPTDGTRHDIYEVEIAKDTGY